MKGIIVDCQTGKVEEIDDGLPMPEYVPTPEPRDPLAEIDDLKQRLVKVEPAPTIDWKAEWLAASTATDKLKVMARRLELE